MGKKKNTPLKAAYMNRVSTFAPLKTRDRNNAGGAIGDGERASTKRNNATATLPSANGMNTRASRHPYWEDCSKPYTRPQRPTVTRMAPGKSRRLESPLLLSGTRRNTRMRVAAAIGRFTKKAARQEI